MVDVFHHLQDVTAFLDDAAFCVKPGGVIVMIEPWVSRWSKLIYRYLHYEPFDPDAKDWCLPKGGPLSQANPALPWMVFCRDLKRFQMRFPEWRIKEIHLQNPFSYLLSGGMTYRSLMPGSLFGICRQIEDMMHNWMHVWAMFARIVLVREN